MAMPSENVRAAQIHEESSPKDDQQNNNKREDEGFKYYPERRGGKMDPGWLPKAFFGEGRDSIDNVRCEKNVYNCVKKSPLVKLMLSALRSAGCEVDIRRNIACESCEKIVTGGYDAELNQVVICQNNARSEGVVQGTLAHELLHMFDQCRAKMDLKNMDHLACTEIRAANLLHCSFLSAVAQGTASPFNIAKRHSECVKMKAAMSVMAVKDVSQEVARAAVDRVFDKCYNDLEPLGRRLRRNSADMEKAYRERYHYGYTD
ncbi:mitochondrial inner membrane protease ATP23 homolog [Ornithodoros turicata]|uniref:mitochondrial inner membrane protease ATP23 homolog n=1 Tax=Ornithodoros turicata TaxID=34597 RepID=UPI003139133D